MNEHSPFRHDRDVSEALDEGHTLHVETEYDRSVRSWRTMILDERGYQIGDAAYSGTRADRASDVARLTRQIEGR